MSKTEIYKNYVIQLQTNCWGYFEAVSAINCDAFMIVGKTIEDIKEQIDL